MIPKILRNGTIYTPTGVLNKGHLIVDENGKISAIGIGDLIKTPDNAEVVDCTGKLVIPGFVDVHVHGGGGFDMLQATFEGLDGMSKFHAERGTTSFLATTSTSSLDRTEMALSNAAEAIGRTTGADLVGIHLEGPYLDMKRRGAQSQDHIRLPKLDEIDHLLATAQGHIRLVTLAPEVEGGYEALSHLKEQGITVSSGHTDATFAEIEKAVLLGLNHTTHHFNGMSPFHHREPGVAGAGMMLPELTTELICDGIHVHPAVVKLLFQVKGVDNVCMITDAVLYAGLPNGDYGRVTVNNGEIYLADGSTLAGSSLTMLQALKNALHYTGYTLETILPSMTSVPARQVCIGDRKGSLEVGKDADFLILTPELELHSTYVLGKEVYRLN